MTSQEAGTSSKKLETQASAAALAGTKDSGSKHVSFPILDDAGRLSSAGAAASFKYARPQDLPSFPSPGLDMASAGAAASLADSNKKSFEYWKPGAIPASNKAAMLAKDYEMGPLWHPELSKAGSKAAMLAYRGGANVAVYKAPVTEEGHSAAGQALRMKQPGAITQREVPPDARQKALMAATGAMAGGRKRAESAPLKPQSPPNSDYSLKAAIGSQKGSTHQSFGSGDPGFEAARLQNMAKGNVNRKMYGSNPPVAIEVEEKNRQDTLRASAVAMARQMFAIQQKHLDEAKAAADEERGRAHHRSTSGISDVSDDPLASSKIPGLEEAARKLAQERLAKLRDEHAEYRQYYGQEPKSQPTRLRLSLRPRRRASSDGQNDEDDEEQSRKIRSQMSIFTSKIAEVDNKKRQTDRDNLMAVAQRNVTASMNSMDERVFNETGKSSPQQRDEWEKQARVKAQADSDTRMLNHGKVHIGGGKYLDQAEIDDIARARLQPTLDEISENAEKQRARDEEIRVEQARLKAEAEKEKVRMAEIKAEQKRLSDQEKQTERARKAEEKRVKREAVAREKNLKIAEKAKDGKSKGLFGFGSAGAATAGEAEGMAEGDSAPYDHTTTDIAEEDEPDSTGEGGEAGENEANEETETPGIADMSAEEPTSPLQEVTTANEDPTSPGKDDSYLVPVTSLEKEPTSPSKGSSKVKSWFKTRFRSGSKTQKDANGKPTFSGGAVFTGAGTGAAPTDKEDNESPSGSMRDVAMAGRNSETDDMYGSSLKQEGEAKPKSDRSSSVSAMSSDTEGNEPRRGRRGFKEGVTGAVASTATHPTTDSTDGRVNGEEEDESRDTFEESQLAPPPKLTDSHVESLKGSKERSKFTEEL